MVEVGGGWSVERMGTEELTGALVGYDALRFCAAQCSLADSSGSLPGDGWSDRLRLS